MTRFVPALLLACVALTSSAQEGAQSPSDKPTQAEIEQMMKEAEAAAQKQLASFLYETGDVELKAGRARLSLPPGYRFIGPNDGKKLIEEIWGNPPGSGNRIEGVVIPKGQDLADTYSWAIVVSFEEDGYVSDHDADDINYDDLLADMKESNAQASEEREKAGYGKFLLTGWALPPRYDKANHVMYWAKTFDIDGPVNSLNYDVRVLGRRGVLSMNAVASDAQASQIDAMTPEIVSMVKFNSGHRYEDFDEATDKKADYSLAGLVLGGAVAAKLLTKVGVVALIAKFGKLLFIPLIAFGAWLKSRFSRQA